MPEINYINPLLKKNQPKDLFAQISMDGFSYSIRSSESKQILLFKYFKFHNILLVDEMLRKVENIIDIEDAIKDKFTCADVVCISQRSTLIPEEFFKPEYLKKYFEFSQNLAEFDELHYTYIPEIKAYNVFGLPSFLCNIFYTIHPKSTFHNQSTTLIRKGIRKGNDDHISAIMGLNNGFFDLVLIQNGNLLLNNSFQYTNSTDFVYFFLYTCKQLKINPADIPVTVFGEAIQEKSIIEELRPQVRTIEIPQIDISDRSPLDNKQRVQFYTHFLLNS